MRKRASKILLVGIVISSCVCFLFLRHQYRGDAEGHFVVKRQINKDSSAVGEKPKYEKLSLKSASSRSAGQLICELPTVDLSIETVQSTTLGNSQLGPGTSSSTPSVIKNSKDVTVERFSGKNMTLPNGRSMVNTNKSKEDEDKDETPIGAPPVEVPSHKLPMVTGWRGERRNIGCCPPGDQNGRAFPAGMACCIDQVYNASDQFCCLLKETVLTNTPENHLFCFPPDRVPFCRITDLNLQRYFPMTVKCRYGRTRKKTPTDCTFICPPGSHVRGDKTVTCLPERGVWDSVDPECCEGCPLQFTQDIWFMLDINMDVGEHNLASMRTFIRMLTSYFPISQLQTRVAVTAFNRVLFSNQNTWFLNRHNSTKKLHAAINLLPSEGVGRNTSQAVLWLANKAFTHENGDRTDVDNTVVLITTGLPDDNYLQDAATSLREIARLIVVAVGKEASYPLLGKITSDPQNQNFLRVPTFQELDNHEKYLYDLFCDKHCLGRDSNS